jgi:hypothetical protein
VGDCPKNEAKYPFKKLLQCEISGFRYGVSKIFAVLGRTSQNSEDPD